MLPGVSPLHDLGSSTDLQILADLQHLKHRNPDGIHDELPDLGCPFLANAQVLWALILK
jgi:hypothetical protein